MVICDFCSSRAVRWRLLTTTDSLKVDAGDIEITNVSVGDWAACDTCMNVIKLNGKESLIERSFRTLADQLPLWMHKEIRVQLGRIHELFWKNYTGMFEPYEKEKP